MTDDRKPSTKGHAEYLWVPDEIVDYCALALRRISDEVTPSPRSIAVTSALPGEGRTTVARGLALALQQRRGREVVLVDIDEHSEDGSGASSARETLGPVGEEVGYHEWGEVARVGDGLGVVWAEASRLTSPTALTGFREQMGFLVDSGQIVVADLPALPPHGNGDTLAAAFDRVVLVVRAGRTSADTVRQAVRGLTPEPVVVLNGTYSSIPRWFPVIGGDR